MNYKIKERRLIFQDWYETEDSKTGWESGGWRFLDDSRYNINDYNWTVTEHLKQDKFGNPVLGIAEKETEI